MLLLLRHVLDNSHDAQEISLPDVFNAGAVWLAVFMSNGSARVRNSISAAHLGLGARFSTAGAGLLKRTLLWKHFSLN